MSSFLFTTIAAVVGVVMLAPSYATNIPTTNPGCTTTVLGADNIANGSASLEPDFSANTINTTWFSNGTQLTGDNIPGTCTYDAALTPPTPAARPGYTFGGWTLRVSTPEPAVMTLSSISNQSISAYGYVTGDCGGECGSENATYVWEGYWDPVNDDRYGFGQQQEWGITFESGIVKGEAGCSYNDSGTPTFDLSGNYCWCRATSLTPNEEEEQSFLSSSWVYLSDMGDWMNCARCSESCANEIRTNSTFRSSVFSAAQ